MRKPRPTPDARFVFDPASDAAYVHFAGRENANRSFPPVQTIHIARPAILA